MIKHKDIELKELSEDDLQYLLKWRNSEDVRPYTREFKPLTMENQMKWYKSLPDSNNIMFGIYHHEKIGKTDIIRSTLIGCCGLTNIDWKNGHTEVSIYIGAKDWQRKGHASTCLQLLLQYAFNELRLHRVYATIFSYNKKSITLFEKNGFTFEGDHKDARFWNGKYYDEKMYSVINNDVYKPKFNKSKPIQTHI